MFDSMVPDELVTRGMVDRFLELSPPIASVIPEFQEAEKTLSRGEEKGPFKISGPNT